MVPLDLPTIESGPIINFRMEIFVTYKFGQYSCNGNYNMVELDNLKNDLTKL